MQVFPLQLFLETLYDDGMRPTVRDYERIQLALQTGGRWTLARFRDVLLALLVRDSDQQEIFLRRFNTFFPDKSAAEKKIAEAQVDVPRILADLRQMANGEQRAEIELDEERTEDRRIQKAVQKPPRRWKKVLFWAGIAVVLILIGAYAVGKFLQEEIEIEVSKARFTIQPSVPWLSELQVHPKDGKPLSQGTAHEIQDALTKLVEEIEVILEKP